MPALAVATAQAPCAGTVRGMTSMAPGQVATPHTLLDAATLAAATDVQLAHTEAALRAEQHRRALDDCDLDAVLEQAFVDGFAASGAPTIPWMERGLLFVPGYIRYKSSTSHDCTFATVNDAWSWECAELVRDVMRQVPGPKVLKQSMSIVMPAESMQVDVVAATSKQGAACQMRHVTSYQVRSGQLVVVTTRAKVVAGHTRSR